MVTTIIGLIIMKISSLVKKHLNGIRSLWTFAKLRVAKMCACAQLTSWDTSSKAYGIRNTVVIIFIKH